MKLFYSYSHDDEKLRAKLVTHLAPLRHEGLITDWHDRKITPGDAWAGKIAAELESADIILLLVSAAFLASDYCRDVEVTRAMARHEAGSARVIPVILRAADWHSAVFGKLQALPTDAQPVDSWRNQDAAFAEVAKGVRAAVLSSPFELGASTLADVVVRTIEMVQHGRPSYARMDAGRRAQIATFLQQVSSCLRRTAERLAGAQLSHEECESLRIHLQYLKVIIAPVVDAGLLAERDVQHLYDELYAAIESPIKIVARLEESRWFLLGSVMESDSPVVVGTTQLDGAEIPVSVGTQRDFETKLRALRDDPTMRVSFDERRAMSEELRKLHIAAGAFAGFANVLGAM